MQIEVSRKSPLEAEADALIVPLAETRSVPRALHPLDAALGAALGAWIGSGQFEGKSGQLSALPAGSGLRVKRVILVGMGKIVDAEALRGAAARALREMRRAKLTRAALCIPALRRPDPEAVAQALAEGALLGHYRFDKYKTADDLPPAVTHLELLLGDARHLAVVRRGARTGSVIAESTNLARDLSNEPGGVATPEYLASQARSIARAVGLRVSIFGERELRQHKMGGILAVGRGSANPPRLIILEHGQAARGARKRPTLALVGKGITFDTGGISIKPADAMDEMKHDMSGGAAVIAALRAVALLRLPLHVVGIVPAAQNMPDGRAYLPGDIVTSANGKTIEVLNTDAEGRVVLSDALHHATGFEPEAIIDLATLTGACIVALGHVCAAVLGNNEPLIRKVIAAGERTRERAWQLPLWDEYKKQIKGSFGDVKNTGGRPGGTITAAAFLSHFVGKSPWAHLDIAGTAWRKGDGDDGPKGATGFGVRLLVELLRGVEVMRARATGTAAVLAAGLLAGVTLAQSPADSADPALGKAKFELFCVSCHGGNGDGMGPASKGLNPSPRDFTVGAFKYGGTDQDIFEVISNGAASKGGSPLMVAWSPVIQEGERWALVKYIRSFKK